MPNAPTAPTITTASTYQFSPLAVQQRVESMHEHWQLRFHTIFDSPFLGAEVPVKPTLIWLETNGTFGRGITPYFFPQGKYAAKLVN
jgi:hypothetical protein